METTAFGAIVAGPERAVVAIAGDGGFMYNVQELATAAQYGINVVAVVFNDNAYGNVRRIQRELYGNRVIASDLRNPDFVRLGESFGLSARRVAGADELADAIARALARVARASPNAPRGALRLLAETRPWTHVQIDRSLKKEEHLCACRPRPSGQCQLDVGCTTTSQFNTRAPE